jgi:hypothetical protein
VGRCRLRRNYQTSFIAPQCNSRGGEAARFRRRGKNDLTRHLTPHTIHPICRGNTATISEMGPTITVRSAKAQGSKVKPVYGSEPPRATRVRDEVTQRMANILAHLVPH